MPSAYPYARPHPRAYPDEVRAEARRLVEETALPIRTIAARLGPSQFCLARWAGQGGWERPPDAPPPRNRYAAGMRWAKAERLRAERARRAAERERLAAEHGAAKAARPRPLRYSRHPHGYVADVVEQVRTLVQGTTLPQAEIARRVGIGPERVGAWTRRRGWVRPADAPVHNGAGPLSLARPARRARDLHRRIAALAERTLAGLRAAPEPNAVAIARAEALVAEARAGAARRPRGRSVAAIPGTGESGRPFGGRP